MRFRWASIGKNNGDPSVVVFDTESPEAEPGELVFFGLFPNKGAAMMAIMSMNTNA